MPFIVPKLEPSQLKLVSGFLTDFIKVTLSNFNFLIVEFCSSISPNFSICCFVNRNERNVSVSSEVVFFKTYSSDNNEASKPSTVYHCCIENNMIEIYENMKKFQIFQGGFSSKLIFMNMQTIYDAFASVYFDMENTFKDVINTIYANALNICRFIKCKVSIETFEDQECYKFEDKMISPYGNDYWYTIYYIDKETLLPAGVECKYKPKDYEKGNYDKAIYQIYINCVTDEDVKLPDLIEYTQIVD